ncbi:conjugative transposon protein TcpC [Nocardia neocaledoniensis]|uniref:Conjugative transposon protein TcpC n=2 Tax=Nocardia neocaledoniensis TaxID=236511 RepID=A0A317N6V6_9NOCA|nr:conjugative transposon protein TcpC [Nocardia neocaledoniensis]
MMAVLVVLAVLGGGHAIFEFLTPEQPRRPDESAVVAVGRAQLVEYFAERFVVNYLSAISGQQERIGEFVSLGQHISLPPTGRQVSDSAVVHAVRTMSRGQLDIWSVTVSVRVDKAASATVEQRQFYRVAVSVSGGQLRALAVPTMVPSPTRGPDLAMLYSTPCGVETPLHQVVSGFVKAQIAGDGDIGRYTTLQSGITALTPVPFSGVEVISLVADDSTCGGAGTRARVLVHVAPKLDGGNGAPLAFPLTLVRGGEQWQVQFVDPVPALAEPLAVVSGGVQSGATSMPSSTTTTPGVSIPPATQK